MKTKTISIFLYFCFNIILSGQGLPPLNNPVNNFGHGFRISATKTTFDKKDCYSYIIEVEGWIVDDLLQKDKTLLPCIVFLEKRNFPAMNGKPKILASFEVSPISEIGFLLQGRKLYEIRIPLDFVKLMDHGLVLFDMKKFEKITHPDWSKII